MQKYISIKDGYSCKKQNPYDVPYLDAFPFYKDFESTNPELPLTEHVEVGEVFEGREGSDWRLNAIVEPVNIHPTQTVGEGEKEIMQLQANLRDLLFVRPYDITAIETAAVKLCDAIIDHIIYTT